MENTIYNILIVDDHPVMRAGLSHIIAKEGNLRVCCEADGMSDALELVATRNPDLVIIDLSLADGSGLDLIERIRAKDHHPIMLVVSMHDELLFAERVLAAGAMGYVHKKEAYEMVIDAIKRVLSGKVYLSESMKDRLLNNLVNSHTGKAGTSPVEKLSNRELTVFELIGNGMKSGKIAEQLKLSIKTIESHQANIKRKLSLASSQELTRKAMQWVLSN